MALYRQGADGLVPVRRGGAAGAGFEEEVRELAWLNLDEISGEELFPVGRQAWVSGRVVDIVALSRQGEVAVIEVTRGLDGAQLAQSLELVGWARDTSLDELAGLYHAGTGRFLADWQDFTATRKPVGVQRNPLIILVALDVDLTTRAALDYLSTNGVPVKVVGVTIYEGDGGVRLIDVQGGYEPPVVDVEPPGPPRRDSRRVGLPDLIEAGLLKTGTDLVWSRPRRGEEYRARITPEGLLALPDGRTFTTPSAAAMAAANMASYDGWHAWRVGSAKGLLLDDLRRELTQA